jgi:hypothetical protein
MQFEAAVGDGTPRILVPNHEHVDQSIAYARMNGIVPPWSKCHFFKSRDFAEMIKTVGRGANIRNLSQGILNELKIPLPPLAGSQNTPDTCGLACESDAHPKPTPEFRNP